MTEEFVMPKLGLTMEAGTITRWLVVDGSEVDRGQPVLVIETDKVESEVESSGSGRLHQAATVGEELVCGATIGWFLAEGEEAPTAVAAAVGGATLGAGDRQLAARGIGGRLLASPNARRVAAERQVDLTGVVGSGPGGRITSEDVLALPPWPAATDGATVTTGGAAAGAPGAPTPVGVAPAPMASPDGGVLATAAARNLADLLGVDLRQVPAAGPDPRITREDVAASVRARLAAASRPLPPLTQAPTSVVPLRGMRGTIARRMTESLASTAQLTLTMDVDMDGIVADRQRRLDRRGADDTPAPGYTDYVIAAAAQALVEHPYVNSQITAEGIALLPSVHVGLAVALDDGLIVPVIHDTLGFDLDGLAAETKRLATAARDRTLALEDLEGGTFTVTSLGMYGVDAFTPIVNTPNTAILGVGRMRDDASWSEDGDPTRTSRLTLSLTWDHRAFDGAPAAEFTESIKRRLESYRT